jgi:hypothetical protein
MGSCTSRSLLFLLAAACGGSSASEIPGSNANSPPSAAGGPNGTPTTGAGATSCGSSALSVVVDGAGRAVTNLSASATENQISLNTPAVVGTPWHILNIILSNPAATMGTVAVPEPLLRIQYTWNANGAPGQKSILLDTDKPAALNWNQAIPSGTVTFSSTGTKAGDMRCGSFDLTLAWNDGVAHVAHLVGTFAEEVRALQNDGRL